MNTSWRGRIGILATAIVALLAVSLPASAAAKDRNHDRIPDKWEKSHKLSLKRDQRKLDQDNDGLRNRGEWRAGTNPRDKDSDDDGVSDLKEKAGVISSYDADTGELTLSLYAGGELTASVTDDTRVQCESEDTAEDNGTDEGDDDGTDDQGSGDVSSRHGGPGSGREGEDESGDDDGGHGGHGGCDGNCSVDDLAEGVEVTQAEIKITADGKVFKELEIIAPTTE